jgi:hypothetical protein
MNWRAVWSQIKRPCHGPFRLRQVQPITAVVFANLLHRELQRTILDPAQHRRSPDIKSKKRERRKPPRRPSFPLPLRVDRLKLIERREAGQYVKTIF